MEEWCVAIEMTKENGQSMKKTTTENAKPVKCCYDIVMATTIVQPHGAKCVV